MNNLIYFSKKERKYYLLANKKVCDSCGDELPPQAIYKVIHHSTRGEVKLFCNFCYSDALLNETGWESINIINLAKREELPTDAYQIIDPSIRMQRARTYKESIIKSKKMATQESNKTEDHRVHSIGYEQRQKDMGHIAHNKSLCIGVIEELKTINGDVIKKHLLELKERGVKNGMEQITSKRRKKE